MLSGCSESSPLSSSSELGRVRYRSRSQQPEDSPGYADAEQYAKQSSHLNPAAVADRNFRAARLRREIDLLKQCLADDSLAFGLESELSERVRRLT